MKATVSWSKRCFQQPTKQFLSSTTSSTSTGKLELTPLTAVSPIDGRYAEQTSQLRHHFSEYALIQQRVTVEVSTRATRYWLLRLYCVVVFIAVVLLCCCQVEWLKYLADRSVVDLKPDAHKALSMLDVLVTQFSLDDAARVKELESTTKHDVKVNTLAE
jgi:adenylosuccinate lyase